MGRVRAPVRLPRASGLALVVAVTLAACSGPSVGAIVKNPGQFQDSLVTVSGTAIDPQGLSFGQAGVGFYTLTDGKDSIKVMASSAPPADQQRIRVTGHVRAGMVLGLMRFGPVIEESQRESR